MPHSPSCCFIMLLIRRANSRSTQLGYQSRLSCSLLAPVESEQTRKRTFDCFSSVQLVQRKVELQNIDSWVAKNPEIASHQCFAPQLADFVFAQATRFCYAGDLQFGVLQTDVRIESAAGSSDCIRRERDRFRLSRSRRDTLLCDP